MSEDHTAVPVWRISVYVCLIQLCICVEPSVAVAGCWQSPAVRAVIFFAIFSRPGKCAKWRKCHDNVNLASAYCPWP